MSVGYTSTTGKLCPAVPGATNPVYQSPGGPTGPDGKCPTGRYQDASEDDIKQKIVANPPTSAADQQKLTDGVKDAIEKGGQSVPSTISTTGPATQQGTPTSSTTTNSQGTTTTTETPTYTYHYDGDTITYDTSSTVQTCVGANSCSTTTTTAPPVTTQDPKDPCTANPNRVGCVDLGTAPDDKLPKSTRDVSFASETIPLGAACPAPVQLPHGQQISYQTVCDGLTQVRPLIIAFGFLMAGGIVVAALRV